MVLENVKFDFPYSGSFSHSFLLSGFVEGREKFFDLVCRFSKKSPERVKIIKTLRKASQNVYIEVSVAKSTRLQFLSRRWSDKCQADRYISMSVRMTTLPRPDELVGSFPANAIGAGRSSAAVKVSSLLSAGGSSLDELLEIFSSRFKIVLESRGYCEPLLNSSCCASLDFDFNMILSFDRLSNAKVSFALRDLKRATFGGMLSAIRTIHISTAA